MGSIPKTRAIKLYHPVSIPSVIVISERKINEGTHNFLGQENNAARIKAGTHNFLGSNNVLKQLESGKHPSQFKWHCEVCGKNGKGKGTFTRFHGDNCKLNK